MTTCLPTIGHVLQQWTEEVKQSLGNPLPEWAFYPQTGIQQPRAGDIVVLHSGEIAAESGIIDHQRDFEIQPQAAHIQIDRTDKTQLTVHQDTFGM